MKTKVFFTLKSGKNIFAKTGKWWKPLAIAAFLIAFMLAQVEAQINIGTTNLASGTGYTANTDSLVITQAGSYTIIGTTTSRRLKVAPNINGIVNITFGNSSNSLSIQTAANTALTIGANSQVEITSTTSTSRTVTLASTGTTNTISIRPGAKVTMALRGGDISAANGSVLSIGGSNTSVTISKTTGNFRSTGSGATISIPANATGVTLALNGLYEIANTSTTANAGANALSIGNNSSVTITSNASQPLSSVGANNTISIGTGATVNMSLAGGDITAANGSVLSIGSGSSVTISKSAGNFRSTGSGAAISIPANATGVTLALNGLNEIANTYATANTGANALSIGNNSSVTVTSNANTPLSSLVTNNTISIGTNAIVNMSLAGGNITAVNGNAISIGAGSDVTFSKTGGNIQCFLAGTGTNATRNAIQIVAGTSATAKTKVNLTLTNCNIYSCGGSNTSTSNINRVIYAGNYTDVTATITGNGTDGRIAVSGDNGRPILIGQNSIVNLTLNNVRGQTYTLSNNATTGTNQNYITYFDGNAIEIGANSDVQKLELVGTSTTALSLQNSTATSTGKAISIGAGSTVPILTLENCSIRYATPGGTVGTTGAGIDVRNSTIGTMHLKNVNITNNASADQPSNASATNRHAIAIGGDSKPITSLILENCTISFGHGNGLDIGKYSNVNVTFDVANITPTSTAAPRIGGCAFFIDEGANVVLTLACNRGSDNVLISGARRRAGNNTSTYQWVAHAGLFVHPGVGATATLAAPSRASLTINGTSPCGTMGVLRASGANVSADPNSNSTSASGGGAGIGGHGFGLYNDATSSIGQGLSTATYSFSGHSGTITINGGTIYANGGQNGTGFSGTPSLSNSMYNGGTGAGIGGGGGWRTDGGSTWGTITINCNPGPTKVTAKGGDNFYGSSTSNDTYGGGGGAGIGGGGAGLGPVNGRPGKKGGSNVGGIYINCGTIEAEGGNIGNASDTDGTNNGRGAGGAGIGGGGAHTGADGGSGGLDQGLIEIADEVQYVATGGRGYPKTPPPGRGNGSNVGDGGQQSDPRITFTSPKPNDELRLYRFLVQGNKLDVKINVQNPYQNAKNLYNWWWNTDDSEEGARYVTLDANSSEYTFGRELNNYINDHPTSNTFYYYCVVEYLNMSTGQSVTAKSPSIKVTLETIPNPQLQFYCNGMKIDDLTAFPPRAPGYTSEKITIGIENVGNIGYLNYVLDDREINLMIDVAALAPENGTVLFANNEWVRPDFSIGVGETKYFDLWNVSGLPLGEYAQKINFGSLEYSEEVTFEELDRTLEVTFLVSNILPTKLEITNEPAIHEYYQGQKLVLDDLVVEMTYSDASKKTFTYTQLGPNNLRIALGGSLYNSPTATLSLNGNSLTVEYTGDPQKVYALTEKFTVHPAVQILVEGGTVDFISTGEFGKIDVNDEHLYIPGQTIKVSANYDPEKQTFKYWKIEPSNVVVPFDPKDDVIVIPITTSSVNLSLKAILTYQIEWELIGTIGQIAEIEYEDEDGNDVKVDMNTEEDILVEVNKHVFFTASVTPVDIGDKYRAVWKSITETSPETIHQLTGNNYKYVYDHTVRDNAKITVEFFKYHTVNYGVETGSVSDSYITLVDYNGVTGVIGGQTFVHANAGTDVIFGVFLRENYRVEGWYIGGEKVTGTENLSSYTLTGVAADATVTVKFEELNKFTVTFGVDDTYIGGGAIDATGYEGDLITSGSEIYDGAEVIFTATPDPGHRIKTWTLKVGDDEPEEIEAGDITVHPNGTQTFELTITENVVVIVSFLMDINISEANIASKYYDGTADIDSENVTFKFTDYLDAEVVDNNITYSIVAAYTDTPNPSYAGTGKPTTFTVTLTGNAAEKYHLINPTDATLTADIDPKPLTITGFTITKVYDGDNSVKGFGTLVFDGIVTGESATVVAPALTAATYNNSSVGTWLINFTADFGMTPGTATVANNYVITNTRPTNETGVITPIPIGSVALGVVEPFQGLLTSAATISSGIEAGKFSLVSLTWKRGAETFNGTFAGGVIYSVEIILEATSNYTFEAALTAVINGANAGVTVSNAPNAGNRVTLTYTFAVTDSYGITLAPDGSTFTSIGYGYTQASRTVTVTVTNTGNVATGALALALSGPDRDNFTLSDATIVSLTPAGTATFTVAPIEGLPIRVTAYSALLTVTPAGNSSAAQTIPLSFAVNQSTLNVSATPNASNINIYGALLSTSSVTGGTVLNSAGVTVAGTWAWATSANAESTYPKHANLGTANNTYTAVFTPDGTDAQAGYSNRPTAQVHVTVLSPKQLTIGDPVISSGEPTKSYDGSTAYTKINTTPGISAGTLGGTVTGGTTVTATISSATYNDANVVSANAITIEYALTGADAGNYIAPVNTGVTATITPAPLAIGGFNISKTYDGDDEVKGSRGTLAFSGLQNSETPSVQYTPHATNADTYNDKDAGEDKPITFNGVFSMTGGTAAPANYEITHPTDVTGEILQKEITIATVAQLIKTFNGVVNNSGDATLAVTFDGLISPETLTEGVAEDYTVAARFTGGSVNYNAGTGKSYTYTVTLNNDNEGTVAKNYSLPVYQQTGTDGVINKAPDLVAEAKYIIYIHASDISLHDGDVDLDELITYSASNHGGVIGYTEGVLVNDDGILEATPSPSLSGERNKLLSYQGAGEEEGEATFEIWIETLNYLNIAAIITFEAEKRAHLSEGDILFIDGFTTYNGQPQAIEPAKVNFIDHPEFGTTIVDDPQYFTYTYSGPNYLSTSNPPTNAGEYRVHVEYVDKIYRGSKTVTFTIAKLSSETSLNVSYMSDVSDLRTYIGNRQNVTIIEIAPYTGLGEATITYEGVEADGTIYAKSEDAPANAGVYTVTVSFEEGDNFLASSSDIELGEMTIGKAIPELGVSYRSDVNTARTYNGNPQAVTINPRTPYTGLGTPTIYYEGVESEGTIYGPTDIPPVDAGKYTVTVTFAEGKNFNAVTTPQTLGVMTVTPAPNQVKVTFDGNGGEPAERIVYVVSGKPVSKPADPTLADHFFAGWYTPANEFWYFDTPVTADLTLQAKWISTTADMYTVVFDYNDGGVTPEETQLIPIAAPTPVSKPAVDPVRDGYNFIGWFYNGNLWDLTETVSSDMTLIANWSEKRDGYYSVVFVYNNNVTAPKTEYILIASPTPVSKPADPTKDGYVFTGWYTEKDLFWDFNIPITRDLTLYADWKPRDGDKWGVTFVYNDGVTDEKIVDVTDGDPVPKPGDPLRTGFTFTGWYSDYRLTVGSEWDFDTPVTGDMFLYAGWDFEGSDTYYAVTFVNNDGTEDSHTVLVPKSPPTPVARPADPDREGYSFTGWHDELDAIWNFNRNVERNVTLYAQWEIRKPGTFTVTFDYQDDVRNPLIVQVTENMPVDDPGDPKRTGYVFTGWYTDQHIFWNFTDRVTKDLILYAAWKERDGVNWGVTFVYNDGVTPEKTIPVADDEKITKPDDPKREGFEFTGWYSDFDLNTLWDFDVNTVTSDMFLYAGWDFEGSDTNYSVTFVNNDGTDETYTVLVPKIPPTPVTQPADPFRAGYSFTGWHDVSGTPWIFNHPVERNMFLYAHWTPKVPGMFTVTFMYNDEANKKVTVSVPENKPVDDPGDAERIGYVFTGWYANGDIFWNFNDPVTKDLVLYAAWKEREENKWGVTFVYNDGVTPEKTIDVADGEKITKPADPEREGFDFTGWYSDNKLTETSKWDFDVKTVDKDMFLYAGWDFDDSDTKFFVTFVYKDGTDKSHTEFVIQNTPVDKPANPVREGYSFTGWYDAAGAVWEFSKPVEGNLFLYAHWVPKIPGKFVVTFFYEDNATNPKIMYVDENELLDKPVDPVREGFIFTGWRTEMGLFWDFNVPITKDLFLYAGWKERDGVKWGVIFVYNDGVTGEKTVDVIDGNPVPNPGTPVRKGFSFTGWYDNFKLEGVTWNFNTLIRGDMFLYAGWDFDESATKYSVTFVMNDETDDVETVFVLKGEPVTQPVDPVRTGYVFTGWHDELGDYWHFDQSVNRNMFLYAYWKVREPGTVAVTFVYNDEDNKTETVTVLENTAVPRPVDPKRDGYVFTGWYTAENIFWDFNEPILKDLFLYAAWKVNPDPVNKWGVTFVYNDGVKDEETIFVTKDEPIDEPADPVREGFDFTGWYSDYDLQTKWDFNTPVTGDMFLYAGWDFETSNTEWAVTFVLNDGTDGSFTEFVLKDSPVTKPADPVRAGYSFTGWYDVFGTDWNFNNPVEKNMFLFAHWKEREPGTWNVTFMYNDNETLPLTVTVADNKPVADPGDPIRNGYIFTGWYTATDLFWDFNDPVTKDLILYATWQERVGLTHGVTFVYNDGVTPNHTETVNENEPVAEPDEPFRDGFNFIGWYSDYDLQTKWDFNTLVTSDIFLYAKWDFEDSDTKYSVTFVLNDGTGLSFTEYVPFSTPVAEPAKPFRDGYSFIGWYDAAGAVWDFDRNVERNMILYAHWVPRVPGEYVVTFFYRDNITNPKVVYVSENDPVTKPTDPERTGYLFTGWVTEKDLFWDFNIGITRDLFLYAGWENRNGSDWGVIFVYNDGVTARHRIDVADGAKVPEPADPIRDGFDFKGWYSDFELTTKWDFNTAVHDDIFLYAKWYFDDSDTKYFVTFVLNDGTDKSFTEFVPFGTPVAEPAKPVRDGYSFTGWYDELGEFWNFTNPVNRNLFLRAEWKVRESGTFTVVFVYNDNVRDPLTISVLENTPISEKPADPQRTGYLFTGWYTDQDFFWDFNIPVNKDLFLYAGWDKRDGVKWGVNFVYNDGVTPTTTVYVVDGLPIDEADIPATPTRDGFTFKGWKTESGIDWHFDFPVTGDLFLHANWDSGRPGTYFVTFVKNDGTKDSFTEFVTRNTPVEKPVDPLRDGYVFIGWYDESGSFWNFRNTVDRNMFLFAKWKERPDGMFGVTYVYNDDVTEPLTLFVPENELINNKPADPKRDGFVFTGWYTETGLFWDFNIPVTRDLFLYAGWDQRDGDKWGVTFVYNDGVTKPNTVYVQKGNPVPNPGIPVREGFRFTGWKTEMGGTINWSFATPVPGDMFLYAGWDFDESVTKYSVTFVMNDDMDVTNTVYVIKGTPVDKPVDPVRENYVFVGWYDELGFIWYFDQNVERNMFLFAEWKKRPDKTFAVKFDYKDGVNNPRVEFVPENTPVAEPKNPDRKDYIFTGWYTEADYLWNFNTPVTKDLNLYAGWVPRPEPGKWGVTFVYNDGVRKPFTDYVVKGEAINAPAQPTRDGFEFTGWYTDNKLMSEWNFTNRVTDDMFLYAGWDFEDSDTKYFVTFIMNNETDDSETVFVLKDTPVPAPDDPVRAGYSFIGWYDESGSVWHFANPVERNIFLYAHWIPKVTGKYIVTFVFNNGITELQREEVDENTAITEPPVPVRTDHAFTGWYKGSGIFWNFNDPVISDMVLYAAWEPRPDPDMVSVTFVYNDDETLPLTIFVKKGDPMGNEYPGDPVRAGYTFAGWLTKSGSFWNLNDPVLADLFLLANWTVGESYTVTFVFDNGEADMNVNVLADHLSTVTPPQPDPTKDGFDFLGWYTQIGERWNFADYVTGNMTLTAKWVPYGQFAVTFVYHNGQPQNTIFVTANDVVPVQPDPVKTDNFFIGWLTDDKMLWDFATDLVTGHMILNAYWRPVDPVNHSVTFVYNNGVKDPETVSVVNGNPVPEPEVPVRTGYIFTGWYTEDAYYWYFDTPITHDMLLIAKWVKEPENQFAVTFIYNDGVTLNKTVYVNNNKQTPVPSEPDPVRTGYIFTGWYTVDNFLWNFADPVTEHMLLIATWTPDLEPGKFSVTFIYNNGKTPLSETVYVAAGSAVNKPADPVWDGYVFTGWYTEDNQLWIFNTPITKSIRLVAHWRNDGADMYRVTFAYNDAGITPPLIEDVKNDNQSIVQRPDNPVWAGYIFIGWYTEDGMLWNFRDFVTRDMLLSAKWEPRENGFYKVTFVYNDGVTLPKSEKVVDNNTTPAVRPYPDPVREGFAFIGWFTEEEKYWDFDTPITGDMLLIAMWIKKDPGQVVVAFIANDSDKPLTYQVFTAGGTATEPDPAPIRTGFELEGWYENGIYTNPKWNFSATVSKDMILIARWHPVWTVTFSVEGGNGLLTAKANGVSITSPASVRAGYAVVFTADPNSGFGVQTWTDNGATATGNLEYVIPNLAGDHNVKVTFVQTQAPVYTVTVRSEGDGNSGTGSYEAGRIVYIKAGTAPAGKRFVNWTTSDGVSFSNASTENTDFVMPDHNVTVTANFIGILNFETYVAVKWNNTLMLNINELRTSDFKINFTEADICEWYRDNNLIHTGATYSAGNGQVLTVGAIYMFKIVTGQGTYYSTPYEHKQKSAAIAYPNPVRSGDMITVEGVDEGSVIQVFSHVGTLVSQFIAAGETTTLTLNVAPGMYVLRTTNGDVKVIIE